MAGAVEVARGLVQIAFFVVVGAVTVLTYLRAKKTLLQPIRAEIFKRQLDGLGEILRWFEGKSEIELREDASLDELIKANTYLLFDTYAELFFDLKIDEEDRPYSRTRCPASVVSLDILDSADDRVSQEVSSDLQTADSRTRAAIWSKHEIHEIRLPKGYFDYREGTRRLGDSPLLPHDLADLIRQYEAALDESLERIGKSLKEVADELPEAYPNADTMKRAQMSWAYNRLNRGLVDLRPKAAQITEYVRDYFKIETLMD